MKATATKTSRRRITRRLILCVALLALLGLAASQTASATRPSPSSGARTFRVGWLLEPENLNPFIGLLGQDYQIWHLNYDFLCGWDPKDFSPRPELAQSWSVSPDGKTWTFKIRQGVKWQDGQPLTAKDVAFTFNYIVKNNLSTLAIYTNGIVSATAPDDTTAVIRTARPKANILAMVVPILPEHIWSKISGKAASSTFQNPVPLIGSGPFQVVRWSKGKYLELKANEDYWGGAPKVDDLLFETYTNPDTMSADLKSGAIDAAVELPLAQVPAIRKIPGVTVIKGTHWRFNELGFNCDDSPDSLGNPAVLDQKFRHALNWAIDRDKIASVAFFGQAEPGSTIMMPYSPYHWQPTGDQAYSYDPAKAKAELDAAGYKDVNGDGFRESKSGKALNLRLFVTTDSTENQTAAKLIDGYFKDVGIKATLRVVDAGALLDAQYNYANGGKTYAPDYDMYIWFWTNDPDPSTMLGVPTKAQIEGWNDTLWWTPQYDKLYAQQAQTIDQAKRIPIVKQMQQVIYQASPYIVFAYPYQMEAYRSDRWQGVVTSPSDVKGYDGSAFYDYWNIDTYRFVTAKTDSTGTSGANTTVLAVVGFVVAIIVIGGIVLVVRRRRRRTVEE